MGIKTETITFFQSDTLPCAPKRKSEGEALRDERTGRALQAYMESLEGLSAQQWRDVVGYLTSVTSRDHQKASTTTALEYDAYHADLFEACARAQSEARLRSVVWASNAAKEAGVPFTSADRGLASEAAAAGALAVVLGHRIDDSGRFYSLSEAIGEAGIDVDHLICMTE